MVTDSRLCRLIAVLLGSSIPGLVSPAGSGPHIPRRERLERLFLALA
jgi:hypothetical protein